MMNEQHLRYIKEHLGNLSGQNIAIVGDVGLDEYVWGGVYRISPEAPVPVVEVEREEARLGLAANVAQNISGLGGIPSLIGVVGRDAAADSLRSLLSAAGVSPEHLIYEAYKTDPSSSVSSRPSFSRPTTRKLRVMAGNHHIVRVDHEEKSRLSAETEAQILQKVQSLLPKTRVLILQDYAKGVLSEKLAQNLISLARQAGVLVLVDPHRTTPLHYYRHSHIMTPNLPESLALAGVGVEERKCDSHVLNQVGQKLLQELDTDRLVITRGKDGMRVFDRGRVVDLPTTARQVFDVTGAGDTVIATLALALAAGFPLDIGCAAANLAAGVVVGKVGCVPCLRSDLEAAIENEESEMERVSV